MQDQEVFFLNSFSFHAFVLFQTICASPPLVLMEERVGFSVHLHTTSNAHAVRIMSAQDVKRVCIAVFFVS